jgi:hypothetical protein
MSFREVGKAHALQRSLQEQARAIEDKLPFDADIKLSTVFFEFPGIDAATMRRQAEVQAVVAG